MMINWNNMDTLTSIQELSKIKPVELAQVMAGENGAERVKKYTVPMAEGMAYNYAAKQVDDEVVAIVKAQYDKAMEILKSHAAKLTELSEYLLERETITGEEFMDILNA